MCDQRYQSIVCLLMFLVLSDRAPCVLLTDDFSGNIRDILLTSPSEKLNILGVFGIAGKSHFDFFKPLLEELARRGHDLTIISHFPRDNRTSPMQNYKDISLINKEVGIFLNVVDFNDIHHSILGHIDFMFSLRHLCLESCTEAINNPHVKNLIKTKKKFDLIITEGCNCDCFLGFVHRFKAPFISLSAHQVMPWINERISNDDNPSYVPSLMLPYGPTMTFWERFVNAITLPCYKLFYNYMYNGPTQALVESAFGPGVPALYEIARNTSLVFVNTHFSLHGSKPNLPSIVEVGGLHISPVIKPLPIELQRFLDEAHEGVLYFSLGSIIKASTMPKEKLEIISKAIGSIPRKVIWKWEVDDFPNKPANLLIRKWLPQSAILRKLYSCTKVVNLFNSLNEELSRFLSLSLSRGSRVFKSMD